MDDAGSIPVSPVFSNKALDKLRTNLYLVSRERMRGGFR